MGLAHDTDRVDASSGQELDVPAEVPLVGDERVRRKTPLDGEVVQVALDRPGDLAQTSTSASGTDGRPWASPTGA